MIQTGLALQIDEGLGATPSPLSSFGGVEENAPYPILAAFCCRKGGIPRSLITEKVKPFSVPPAGPGPVGPMPYAVLRRGLLRPSVLVFLPLAAAAP